MAQTKFQYVRKFEQDNPCLLNCWIVVRLDGQNFHQLAETHEFSKPNDKRALDLMNRAALSVMDKFKEIVISYGQSDEFSFVFSRETSIFGRRHSKILSTVCSHFTSAYIFHWKDYFGDVELKYPPSFDGRIVMYPTNRNLRDYLSWRQADCHINNLYNTTFWALVQIGDLSRKEAEERIRHTVSAEKNEILFSEFNINYNSELEQFKKGSIILRNIARKAKGKDKKQDKGTGLVTLHCDIIGDTFWEEHSNILVHE